MRTVKGLEDKGLLTKTQRHDQKGDYTSNLFRLFSADPPTFPPSQNPAASDAPAGGVTETPALSQWKDGVFTGTARVVSHSDQNVSQSELSPTNDRAVVASTDIPDLDAKAQVALENALARGVEIVNPVAYKDGVRRNLLAQAQGALEKQAQDAHRKAEAERRANCTTCGGDGWIDTSADGYIECPDCAPAAAR